MHGGRLRPVCAASASRAWAPGPWEQLPCAQLSETAGHCAKIEFLQCHGHRAAGPDRLKCWAERGHRPRQGLHSGKAGRCRVSEVTPQARHRGGGTGRGATGSAAADQERKEAKRLSLQSPRWLPWLGHSPSKVCTEPGVCHSDSRAAPGMQDPAHAEQAYP